MFSSLRHSDIRYLIPLVPMRAKRMMSVLLSTRLKLSSSAKWLSCQKREDCGHVGTVRWGRDERFLLSVQSVCCRAEVIIAHTLARCSHVRRREPVVEKPIAAA